MAINPVRFLPMEVPANPTLARPDFAALGTGLADLGRSFSGERDRNEVGNILRGAIDPKSGGLDFGKAATALAVTGRDPEIYLRAFVQQESARRQDAAQQSLAAHYRELERQGNERLTQPKYDVNPPDPVFGGGGIVRQVPGQMPEILPYPNSPAAPPAAAPRPQSALPGGPSFAEAEPESASPYRVAGPPMPPPQAPATTAPAEPSTQPAATAGRNDAYLRSLPTDVARTLVKGIADYEIDPASIDAKYRTQLLSAAKTYRPDFSSAEYQKRGSPPSPEAAARIGLARGFIERLDDASDERGNPVPGLRSRIAGGELNSYQNRAMAMVGQGGPGEIRRGIDEGADALLRTLTGAGMNREEATNYARRYQFSPIDTQETQSRKLHELEAALRHVATEMGKGRGGDDLLKGFKSQYGQPVTTAPATRVPDTAIRALQANPALKDEFDRKYGTGAAERALGRR